MLSAGFNLFQNPTTSDHFCSIISCLLRLSAPRNSHRSLTGLGGEGEELAQGQAMSLTLFVSKLPVQIYFIMAILAKNSSSSVTYKRRFLCESLTWYHKAPPPNSSSDPVSSFGGCDSYYPHGGFSSALGLGAGGQGRTLNNLGTLPRC